MALCPIPRSSSCISIVFRRSDCAAHLSAHQNPNLVLHSLRHGRNLYNPASHVFILHEPSQLLPPKVEIYGYGGRCGAYKNTASLFAYALSNNGALLAPVLFAASIYMTLSRIIRAVRGEQHSIIPMKWLTKVFVVGDIASFAVQASSTGLSVTSHGTAAKAVVLLGLFIQLISFGFFGVTAAVFYRRVLRAPTSECFHSNLPWESSLHMLFAVSALIMIRSIFRVIEYWGGESGYLLQHEWPMYVFDSVPMLVVMALFYIRYPSCIRDKGHDKEQSERPIDAVG